MPNAKARPNARRRAVVHFTPEEGGAWLETETAFEMTMPEPLPLPSATESSSFFHSRQTPVQQVAMLSTDGGAANDNSIKLAQFTSSGLPAPDGVSPLPGTDGIVTMQTAWQTSVAPTGFGHFLGGTKPLREGRYELAVWGTAAVTGLVFDELPVGLRTGHGGDGFGLEYARDFRAAEPVQRPSSCWRAHHHAEGI
jgi:hypothetical protein